MLKAFGGLDLLMLNHALITAPGYWNSTAEELDQLSYVMETNFLSFIHLVSNAMPHLAESKGSIGVVSSVGGKLFISTKRMFIVCFLFLNNTHKNKYWYI